MIFKFVLNNEIYGSLILENDPEGWRNIECILKRSLEYHGIFYEVVAQLDFRCGSGKEYIDRIILEQGIDAVIGIVIYMSCSQSSGVISAPDYSIDYSDDYGSNITGEGVPIFETLFEGVLNLSNYTQTSESTTVDLIQSDFIQKIINRFEAKVNLDKLKTLENNTVDALTNVPYDLTLPSKAILFKTKYSVLADSDSINTPFANDGIIIELPLSPDLDEIGGAVANSTQYMWSFLSSGGANGIEHAEPVFTNFLTEAVTLDMSLIMIGDITMRNTFGPHVNHQILIQVGFTQFSFATYPINPFPIFTLNNIVVNGGIPFTTAFNGSYSAPVTVPSGESVFIVHYFSDVVGNSASPGLFEFISATYSTFKLEFSNKSITSPSLSKSYLIHEVGAMVAQRITGQNDAFRSELLGRKNSQPTSYDDNGCFSFVSITNGKKIRQFPIGNDLTMSMSQFFKTVNSIQNIGLGFEKIGDDYVLRMEGKEYFYSTDVILQLPNCPKIKTSVAKEFYTTNIKIGFDAWESEETNGIDEFCTVHEYNTGIKAMESNKELLSPFIASSYAFEFTRRKDYFNFPSLDWKYDNDNFIVCLNRSVDGGGVPNNLNTVELDENYSQINNIYSPESTYNYRLTPARSLLRHIKTIAGSILKYPLRAIKFGYGEGNYLAQTQFTDDNCSGNFQNELLGENQGITVEDSGESAIWIPEYLEFEYPLKFSEYLLIKANQFKCIEVSDNEEDFQKGFIVELSYKPVGGLTSFKLLKANVN